MEITLDVTIYQVTVFPDRARVTCRGRCDLTTGAHRLLIEELPLALEPDSVRISGQGTARVRLLSVDVERRHYEVTPARQARELEEQHEQLADALRVLEDRKAGWLAHTVYLNGLRQATAEYARGLARGRSTVADQAQLVHFLQEQDAEARAAVRELEIEQRQLSHRLEKVRRELEQVRAARPRQRYRARVEIESLSEGFFEAQIAYVVGNAGWQPLYDVRLQDAGDDNGRSPSLEVSYIAQVTQNSGQDWRDVQLTVSTARPALNQRLPALKPWYIDVYIPPQPLAPAPPMMRSMTLAAPAAKEMEDFTQAALPEVAPMAAEVALATAQASGATVSFAVEGRTDIPSDGSPHKVTVNQFRLEPQLDYLSVPRHTDAVYRRATVTNTSASPLLAGPVSLFVGDEFIGRNQLEYTPVGGEVELLLGVEERITIERELEKRDVDKRLLRDHRQLRYGYKIAIKNLLPLAARMEVHDQIPVARHEQIKIKLEQVKPEPAERSDLNLLEWRFLLPAGEEQTIRYEYTVEHPRALRVMGLPDE